MIQVTVDVRASELVLTWQALSTKACILSSQLRHPHERLYK